MGGFVIETVRPGVQFIPAAASAFRRAEAQVLGEFGRPIDVNSTFRSWDDQMKMFEDWGRWVNGTGPRPAHSKAIHPSKSRHTNGTALDSDDWTSSRIVAILADNGFIRNQLHVPGERHHFEYIESRDNHRGDPAPAAPIIPEGDEDMKFKYITDSWDGKGKPGWVLLRLKTGKIIGFTNDGSKAAQNRANRWAIFWGNAEICDRQHLLDAIDALTKTD